MFRYLLFGGAIGFCAWLAIPIVFGLPVGILTHSGDAELHALGHRIDDATAPAYRLWELPSELGDEWAQAMGLVGAWRWNVGGFLTLFIPIMTGMVGGLALWAFFALRQSLIPPERESATPTRPSNGGGSAES